MLRTFQLRGFVLALGGVLLASCQTVPQNAAGSGANSAGTSVRQETRIDMASMGHVDPPYPWQAYYHELQANIAMTLDNPFLALDEVNKALPYRPGSVYLALLKTRILVKVGNLPEAEKTVNELITRHPSRLRPWLLLGSVLQMEAVKEQDPEKQKAILRKIIPVYREHVLILDSLKEEGYIALFDLYSRLGETEKGFSLLEEGVEKNQGSAYLPFYLGFQYSRKGQIDRGISFYQMSVDRDPRFSPALDGLGDLYSKKGLWVKARDVYEKLLSLEDIGRIGLEVKLLKTYFALKQYPEAVLLLKRAIQEHPQNNRLPLILSSILVEENRYDEAIHQIEKILKSHPENPRLLSFLGSVYEKSLHFTEAIATYHLMIRRFPNLYEGSYNLGDLYRRLDNSPKAILYLKDAESLSPERWEIPFSIAMALMDQKKYPQALRMVRKAMVLSPENPILIFNEGILYDQWNHKKYLSKVRALIRKSLKIDPGFADALNYLGYTEVVEHGNLVMARYDILHALTVDPKNGAYRDSLGWLYDRQGHYFKAFREETRALALMPHDPTVLDHQGRIERHLRQEIRKKGMTGEQQSLLELVLGKGTAGAGPGVEGFAALLATRSMNHLRESILIHPLKSRRVLRYLTWFGAQDKTFLPDFRGAVRIWVKTHPDTGPLQFYRVETGDTLQSISAKASVYGTPRYWRLLRRANRTQIKNPNDLPWGVILRIPKLPVHVTKKSPGSGASLNDRTQGAPARIPLT